MEDFKDRLDHILRSKNLTAKKFAELMEIQPSNVSHLLSGRNKPSLDFLIKLKEVFPEYSFDWIIMGKKPITINEPTPVTYNENNLKFDDIEDERVGEFDDLDEHVDEDENNFSEKFIDNQKFNKNESDIEKIVLVYSDKTFEIIVPKNNCYTY
jgi:transcriptional regulator with XRE-family HTH domain